MSIDYVEAQLRATITSKSWAYGTAVVGPNCRWKSSFVQWYLVRITDILSELLIFNQNLVIFSQNSVIFSQNSDYVYTHHFLWAVPLIFLTYFNVMCKKHHRNSFNPTVWKTLRVQTSRPGLNQFANGCQNLFHVKNELGQKKDFLQLSWKLSNYVTVFRISPEMDVILVGFSQWIVQKEAVKSRPIDEIGTEFTGYFAEVRFYRTSFRVLTKCISMICLGQHDSESLWTSYVWSVSDHDVSNKWNLTVNDIGQFHRWLFCFKAIVVDSLT